MLTSCFSRICKPAAARSFTSAASIYYGGSSSSTLLLPPLQQQQLVSGWSNSRRCDVKCFRPPTDLSLLNHHHPLTPVTIGWMDPVIVERSESSSSLQLMNRNARHPKKANHGKRPCSRIRRRTKRRQYGSYRR